MKNYYEILEVHKRASKEVIEKAYKVLVKRYHPDLYEGEKKKYAEQRIKDINEAYRILSDDFLREQYDLELEKERQARINNSYKDTRKMNFNKEENIQEKSKKVKNKSNVGTFMGLIDLVKELIKNKPKREEVKEITKKDLIAFGLTIVAVIIIGILLWFIPFTNGWMRQLLFENPLFNWIGSLFS